MPLWFLPNTKRLPITPVLSWLPTAAYQRNQSMVSDQQVVNTFWVTLERIPFEPAGLQQHNYLLNRLAPLLSLSICCLQVVDTISLFWLFSKHLCRLLILICIRHQYMLCAGFCTQAFSLASKQTILIIWCFLTPYWHILDPERVNSGSHTFHSLSGPLCRYKSNGFLSVMPR